MHKRQDFESLNLTFEYPIFDEGKLILHEYRILHWVSLKGKLKGKKVS